MNKPEELNLALVQDQYDETLRLLEQDKQKLSDYLAGVKYYDAARIRMEAKYPWLKRDKKKTGIQLRLHIID